MYAPENAPQAPADDTETIYEVTQYTRDPNSSLFNSTSKSHVLEQSAVQNDEASNVQLTKLQHEVALLRSKLVSQVKANTRLKAAFNALSENNPSKPPAGAAPVALNTTANLSMSINPSILEEAGNTSLVNESLISLLGSNQNVAQILDKTVNELKSALSKVEVELSASILEDSKHSEDKEECEVNDAKAEADVKASASVVPKPDRLRDVYSLIKGLVVQFDNLQAFRRSFHETVNRSILAASHCLETSSITAESDAQENNSAAAHEASGELKCTFLLSCRLTVFVVFQKK